MSKIRNESGAGAHFFEGTTSAASSCPPAFLEYAWYVNLIYMFLGQAWGIVIPSVGGVIWVLVAVGCFLSVHAHAIRVYKPVALALLTGVLVIAIQLLFHEGSAMAWHEGIDFVAWIAMMITAQALSLRPGFLQRFALVAVGIGLASVPFIQVRSAGTAVRAWASGTGIGNPNALGMWFGFCTVYFVIWGLHSKKPIYRASCWTVAVGCLYMVLLSVSRAPLLGIVLGCIVGLRPVLKRAYAPLFSLVLLICLVYMSGVFDEEIDSYFVRGAEETGREVLWSAGMERFLDAPWIGYGLGDIKVMRNGRLMNPHNGLLHIALGAGILPLMCFSGYLAKVGIETLRIMWRVNEGEAALLPPLVVFAFLEVMMLDYAFLSPWIVVIFGMAAGASEAYAFQRAMTASQVTAKQYGRPKTEATSSIRGGV
ncbi:MAG: O-antigen ligase family protein [Nitrospira sp.]